MADSARDLLRHALATIAYRGGKAVRAAPPGFASFQAGTEGRTPVQILAHVGDLFDWGVSLLEGGHAWRDSTPLPWDAEIGRFFEALGRLDRVLAGETPLGCSVERVFQGPIADALTHVGQIAMLRRLSGAPVRAENYFKADIAAGRVGADQSAPRAEFD